MSEPISRSLCTSLTFRQKSEKSGYFTTHYVRSPFKILETTFTKMLRQRQFGSVRRLVSRIGVPTHSFSSSSMRPVNAVRLNKHLIVIAGPDTLKFLNGVVTNTLNDQAGVFAAFLNSKGRMLADTFLYPLTQSLLKPSIASAAEIPLKFLQGQMYVVEVDSAVSSDIRSMLNTHKLRAKVFIRELDPNQFGTFSIWDDHSPHALTRSVSQLREQHLVVACNDPRAPGFGIRVICGQENFALNNVFESVETLHLQDYKIRRYLYGIPEGSEELPSGSALPLESSIDYMNGVNFDKGCYVGQELTIRSYHHGVVRKRILPVAFTEDKDHYNDLELNYNPQSVDNLESKWLIGSSITNLSGEEMISQIVNLASSPFEKSNRSVSKRPARPSGTVIGTVGNIGLALVRLDHFAQPTAQFGISVDGREILLKGFIPFWWPQ